MPGEQKSLSFWCKAVYHSNCGSKVTLLNHQNVIKKGRGIRPNDALATLSL